MKIGTLHNMISGYWMIDPQTANAQLQAFRGMMMGLEFEKETPDNSYAITHGKSDAVPQGRNINVVSLLGTMLRDDGDCGQEGTRTIAKYFEKGESDPKCLGHILVIDSGGGQSSSVPEMSDAIVGCKKPVVAFVDGMMASAAMYVGSYCDHIIAHRENNEIGCIGTLIQIAGYPKRTEMADGEICLRIYADGAEEKNGEFEKALEGDYRPIREQMLNPLNEQFKEDIRKNRPVVEESQLHGRTYFAKDVVGTLIDAIGTFDDAARKVVELSNAKITKMNIENIRKIESCEELVDAVDGEMSFTEEQVNAIDATLARIDENRQTVEDCEAKIAELTSKISENENSIAERDNIIAERDSRIAELEAYIAENKPQEEELPMANGAHVEEQEVDYEISEEEALDFARKVRDRKYKQNN